MLDFKQEYIKNIRVGLDEYEEIPNDYKKDDDVINVALQKDIRNYFSIPDEVRKVAYATKVFDMIYEMVLDETTYLPKWLNNKSNIIDMIMNITEDENVKNNSNINALAVDMIVFTCFVKKDSLVENCHKEDIFEKGVNAINKIRNEYVVFDGTIKKPRDFEIVEKACIDGVIQLGSVYTKEIIKD